MKIQIALSSNENEAQTDTTKAPTPQGGAGDNYAAWTQRMNADPKCKEIKRLDNNKMVAVDAAGNPIETFVIDTERKNLKVDTLDSEQNQTPADKTAQDNRVDPKVEKGA